MTFALELDAITKRRGAGPAAVTALRGVTLHVDAGEVVLLQGPSGSGKTTLLGVAGGLLVPDAGDVRIAGRPLGASTHTRQHVRACSVGFVFQRSNLLSRLTAGENVLIAALQAGIPRARALADTRRLLARLGIQALCDRHPGEMSGGEEQRVAVARALVHRPPLVLADEPTGSLDSRSGQAVAEALAELAREQGAGVLIVTHDRRLDRFATRILQLADGVVA